jgi:antitoxin component YwqK of YwqJK toxin-antitoxin module
MDNILTPYGFTASFAEREVLPDGTFHFKDDSGEIRCIQTHDRHNRVESCYMVNTRGQRHGLFRQFDENGCPQWQGMYKNNEKYGPHTFYRKRGKPLTVYYIGKETMGEGAWKKRTGERPARLEKQTITKPDKVIVRKKLTYQAASPDDTPVISISAALPASPVKAKTTLSRCSHAPKSANPVQTKLTDEQNCTPYDCIEVFVRCDVRLDGTKEYYNRKGTRRCKQLFHDNGRLCSQIFYDAETGQIPTDQTNFDKNGKLSAIIPYKDGDKHGQEVIIHPSGKIEMRYHYEDTDVGSIAAWLEKANNTDGQKPQISVIHTMKADMNDTSADPLEEEIRMELYLLEDRPPDYPPAEDITEALISFSLNIQATLGSEDNKQGPLQLAI